MTVWEVPQAAFTAQAVTSETTYSSELDHLRVVDAHAVEVVVSAFSTSDSGVVNVLMQGSLDGTNWYDLASDEWSGVAVQLLTGTSPARYTRVIAGTTDSDTTATITVTIVSGASA